MGVQSHRQRHALVNQILAPAPDNLRGALRQIIPSLLPLQRDKETRTTRHPVSRQSPRRPAKCVEPWLQNQNPNLKSQQLHVELNLSKIVLHGQPFPRSFAPRGFASRVAQQDRRRHSGWRAGFWRDGCRMPISLQTGSVVLITKTTSTWSYFFRKCALQLCLQEDGNRISVLQTCKINGIAS